MKKQTKNEKYNTKRFCSCPGVIDCRNRNNFRVRWKRGGYGNYFYVFSMFQGKFAIITPALIAGAFAERVTFKGYVVFIALWRPDPWSSRISTMLPGHYS
ncbi:MAG: ammonium transporter [Bacteroidales bacterium]|nr:ammonium transporter [Bacteroidales bacterium]